MRVILTSVMLLGASSTFAAPTIQILSPTVTSGWVVAPVNRTYSDAVTFNVQANDSSGSLNVGIMDRYTCNAFSMVGLGFPKLPTGVIQQNGSIASVTMKGGQTTVQFSIEIARTAASPVLSLCAVNSATGEQSTLPVSLSDGNPAKKVSIAKATYSPTTGNLIVQGSIIPNGRNKLLGSEVVILDENNNQLGVTQITGKRFSASLFISANPGQIIARVVTTNSPSQALTIVH
jgi:hypothetical protein